MFIKIVLILTTIICLITLFIQYNQYIYNIDSDKIIKYNNRYLLLNYNIKNNTNNIFANFYKDKETHFNFTNDLLINFYINNSLKNNTNSMYMLGIYYYINKKYDLMVKYHERAIKNNYLLSMCLLGNYYNINKNNIIKK